MHNYLLKYSCFNPFAVISLTVDNVTKVMELVAADKIMLIWERLNIPESLVKYVTKTFSTMKEQIRACVDLYVNCFPDEPSWITIASGLYSCDEMVAAREAKPFYYHNGNCINQIAKEVVHVPSYARSHGHVHELNIIWYSTATIII